MELFAKVVHGIQLLTFAKSSMLDVLNTRLYGFRLITVKVAFYCILFAMHVCLRRQPLGASL